MAPPEHQAGFNFFPWLLSALTALGVGALKFFIGRTFNQYDQTSKRVEEKLDKIDAKLIEWAEDRLSHKEFSLFKADTNERFNQLDQRIDSLVDSKKV